MTTWTYSGTLTVMTCWCGMRHAVPAELAAHQMNAHNDGRREVDIYCPLGHAYVPAGVSEVERVRRELERSRRQLANRDEDLRSERASHAATKGHLTKTRKRVGKGVCPCCNRHFTNVERHMSTQHPDYWQEA
jgi:hypothetical protein